jgi:hypothetical protein
MEVWSSVTLWHWSRRTSPRDGGSRSAQTTMTLNLPTTWWPCVRSIDSPSNPKITPPKRRALRIASQINTSQTSCTVSHYLVFAQLAVWRCLVPVHLNANNLVFTKDDRKFYNELPSSSDVMGAILLVLPGIEEKMMNKQVSELCITLFATRWFLDGARCLFMIWIHTIWWYLSRENRNCSCNLPSSSDVTEIAVDLVLMASFLFLLAARFWSAAKRKGVVIMYDNHYESNLDSVCDSALSVPQCLQSVLRPKRHSRMLHKCSQSLTSWFITQRTWESWERSPSPVAREDGGVTAGKKWVPNNCVHLHDW